MVIHDLVQRTPGRVPRHARAYADLKTVAVESVTRFRDEVRQGTFPGPQQTRLKPLWLRMAGDVHGIRQGTSVPFRVLQRESGPRPAEQVQLIIAETE